LQPTQAETAETHGCQATPANGRKRQQTPANASKRQQMPANASRHQQTTAYNSRCSTWYHLKEDGSSWQWMATESTIGFSLTLAFGQTFY
jgi:hypothetical protein